MKKVVLLLMVIAIIAINSQVSFAGPTFKNLVLDINVHGQAIDLATGKIDQITGTLGGPMTFDWSEYPSIFLSTPMLHGKFYLNGTQYAFNFNIPEPMDIHSRGNAGCSYWPDYWWRTDDAMAKVGDADWYGGASFDYFYDQLSCYGDILPIRLTMSIEFDAMVNNKLKHISLGTSVTGRGYSIYSYNPFFIQSQPSKYN